MKVDPELAREYREAGWWRDETFLDDLKRHAAQRPDQAVVIGYLSASGQTETISYAELARRTGNVARGLVRLGIRPGEFIGAQLPDRWEVLPLVLGCMEAGVYIAPVPPEYRRAELEYMFRLTGARLFVTVAELHGGKPAEVTLDVARDLGVPQHLAVLGDGGPDGAMSFERYFLADSGQDADLTGRRLEPDEPFLLLFTSGTTGENKGAMHSQNTMYAGIRGYVGSLGLDETLVKLTPHTSMHYVGLIQGLLTPMALGGTAINSDSSDPGVSLDLIERHGITMFYGSPAYVRELQQAQRARPRDVSSLTCTVSGSAPVPPQLLAEVREALGVRMFSLWGMSENGPVTLTRPDDPEDWPVHSDGRATGGMEIRIEPVDGQPAGSGVLKVRGPAQCLGYYQRDEAYAADLDEDGWFNTGDLARDDGRGGIRICGRVKDIIIHRSANVPVADIEAVLGKHPKVGQVALIGIPDAAVDERVCAVVTAAGDTAPTLRELRDFLDEAGVSSWCWPERLEVIDALPRTPLGKIRKIDLRKRYPVM
jgi:cyclohexanecarboxylate-CoA ligase